MFSIWYLNTRNHVEIQLGGTSSPAGEVGLLDEEFYRLARGAGRRCLDIRESGGQGNGPTEVSETPLSRYPGVLAARQRCPDIRESWRPDDLDRPPDTR